MNMVISSQINALISRGMLILQALDTELKQLATPGASIARDLITEGVSSLAVEFFGGRACHFNDA